MGIFSRIFGFSKKPKDKSSYTLEDVLEFGKEVDREKAQLEREIKGRLKNLDKHPPPKK
jgi:hypothetical protein